MDYTREPIIETVITPKEGCKLVLRNTKGSSQEEYFVDALEVVSFGTTHFFRSLEKPKPFLLPTTDFEVLEVREPRMILKTPGSDRSMKIGGKEKEKEKEKEHHPAPKPPKEVVEKVEEKKNQDQENGGDRKRNRRSSRRRRDRDDEPKEGAPEVLEAPSEKTAPGEIQPMPRLISPPDMLISETLLRYRESDEFKGAFYDKEAEVVLETEEVVATAERPFFSEGGEFDEGDDLLFRMETQEPPQEGRVKPRRRREELPEGEDPYDNPPLIDEE